MSALEVSACIVAVWLALLIVGIALLERAARIRERTAAPKVKVSIWND
jgi:hypothetical protein